MTNDSRKDEKSGIEGIHFNASPGRMYPNGNFVSIFVGLANQFENSDGSNSLQGVRVKILFK